jgi:hypothetical protein
MGVGPVQRSCVCVCVCVCCFLSWLWRSGESATPDHIVGCTQQGSYCCGWEFAGNHSPDGIGPCTEIAPSCRGYGAQGSQAPDDIVGCTQQASYYCGQEPAGDQSPDGIGPCTQMAAFCASRDSRLLIWERIWRKTSYMSSWRGRASATPASSLSNSSRSCGATVNQIRFTLYECYTFEYQYTNIVSAPMACLECKSNMCI